MEKEFAELARATLQILRGTSRGSGFHFLKPEIIVTNHHVIAEDSGPVTARTEGGTTINLEELAASPADEADYAIFRPKTQLPTGRKALQVDTTDLPSPGIAVLFAGFPHGIDDLLIQQAVVAGSSGDKGFYLDGSVNGGNSGGPIVNKQGELVGIVTQRRFLGGESLKGMGQEASRLAEYCGKLAAGKTEVAIMGIDFTSFAHVFAKSNLLLKKVLEANANTGLGVGFTPRAVVNKCEELNLI